MPQLFMKRFLCMFGVCLFLLSSFAFGITELKVITLQHRFAEDLIPTIEPMIGPDGTISGYQNQLIVRANPQNMAEIEKLVATLDAVQKNLKISVSRSAFDNSENSNLSVTGRKRFGDIEVGTRYPGNQQGARVDIDQRESRRFNDSLQHITVMDGREAFISVGEIVPFTQEWVTLTRRYASIQKTTEFVDVTTGFAVRPRSLGEVIELEITPRIKQLNSSGFIDYESLSSVVQVNRGEWLDLGGLMQGKDEVSRAILSRQSSRQNTNNQLRVRVE
ncbi:MAG: nodulation protein NolW [Methylotenera sp.]|nr:MAG: nodulation protein NolW [Methylotenera sp.]